MQPGTPDSTTCARRGTASEDETSNVAFGPPSPTAFAGRPTTTAPSTTTPLAGIRGGDHQPSTAAQIAAAAGHINPVNAHQGNADAQRKSASAFDNRSSILIAKMRTHCPSAAVESAIDEMLFKHENELEGRVVLTPIYPANWHVVALQGQPLQGPELAEFQINGNSLARHVLAMVQRMGKPKTTPLGMINEETTWSLIKLEDVGMSKETPTKLKSHLDSINRTRVVKKSDEDKRIKFLSLLVQPPAIFARATAELQSCCAEWQTGGMPDYSKTVEGMQELWDTFYPASGMRDRPAPRFPSETSNRVDGLNLETVTHATPPPSSRRTGAHRDALALEMPDGSIAGSAELDAYVDAMLADEKLAYDAALASGAENAADEIDLDMQVRVVDGDEVIADTASDGSFLRTCAKFEDYIRARFPAAA